MGWAQRAKVSAGNPTPAMQTVRYLNDQKFAEACRQTKGRIVMKATYSNREYSVDRNGTYRRLRPSLESSTGTFSRAPTT